MPGIKLIFVFTMFCFLTSCFETKKDHGLSAVPTSQFTYRGEVDRSVKLKFKVSKKNISTLIAQVEAERDYDFPFNYEWKLGEQLALSEGRLTGQVNSMKKNQPVEFVIKVTGFNTDAARYVRFEIIGTNPAKPLPRVFADGVISSHMESSFENIVQEVEQYKKDNK